MKYVRIFGKERFKGGGKKIPFTIINQKQDWKILVFNHILNPILNMLKSVTSINRNQKITFPAPQSFFYVFRKTTGLICLSLNKID